MSIPVAPLVNDLLIHCGIGGADFLAEFDQSYARSHWWSSTTSRLPGLSAFSVRARRHGDAIVASAALRDDVLLDMETRPSTLRIPVVLPLTVEIGATGIPIRHIVGHPLTRRSEYLVERIIHPADTRHRLVLFRAELEPLIA